MNAKCISRMIKWDWWFCAYTYVSICVCVDLGKGWMVHEFSLNWLELKLFMYVNIRLYMYTNIIFIWT